MSLLTRLGHWVLRAAGNQDQGWSIVRGAEPHEYQRSGRSVRRLGWEGNPVVQACARVIVDIVASVDFEVYVPTPTGAAVKPKHPAANLLNTEPRLGVNGYSLRGRTALHYLLYGNALWVLERRGRKIGGIRVLHPERLAWVQINAKDQITRYDWRDNLGQLHESPAEDVVHFRDLTATEDGLFGFPRAAAALSDIATDAEATLYVREVVGNHGTPGLVVNTKGYSNQEELRAAEDRFNERMVSRGGRGRSIFVQGEEMSFEQIGFNLDQLEFPELRNITREDICMSFAVDPRIVGAQSATSDGGMSGIQYKEARFRLIQQAVMPVMKSFESELNRWYMPEFGEELIRFRPDTLAEMTEDEMRTSTRVIQEVAAGIRTVEEARETVGMTAKLTATEHMIGSITLKTVTEAMAPPPAPAAPALPHAPSMPALPHGGGNGNGHHGAPATDPTGMPSANRMALLPPVTGEITTRTMLWSEADRGTYWRSFDTRASEEEPSFLRRIHDLFDSEWVRLAGLFALRSYVNILDQVAQLYAAAGPFAASWAEALRAPIRESISAGARQALGLTLPIAEAAMQGAARRQAQDTAREVTQTTHEQIRGLLQIAEGQHYDPQAAAKLVHQAVFGMGLDARATMIARTEITRAMNQGAYLAAREEPTIQTKHWVSQRDDRVRDSHRHTEQQGWIWVEQAFQNGLQFPGDPAGPVSELANCRCTVAYSTAPLRHHLQAEKPLP